jgi:hypothetical protein
VIDSAQLSFERYGLLFDTFMNCFEYFNKNIQLPLKSQLNFDLSQLSLADTDQGFFRPFTEPINGTSINQRWEHSQSGSKSVTNGTHAHDDVNVSLDSGQVH